MGSIGWQPLARGVRWLTTLRVSVGAATEWPVLGGLVLAASVVSLPSYLVAAQSVQMRSSLHFSAPELGVAVASYYAGSVAFAFAGGWLSELVGGPRVLRYCMILSAVVLLGIAFTVHSLAELAAALVLGGAASTAGQAASNLVISRRVSGTSQGLAFGVKQGAVPLAFMIAGLAVPAVTLTVGWRWAFAGAGVLALSALSLVPRPRSTLSARVAHRGGTRPKGSAALLVLACGFGLALMSCSSLSTYVVSSSVEAGLAPGAAGILVAVASLGSVSVRVLTGLWADRTHGEGWLGVVMLLGLGGFGTLILALGSAYHSVALVCAGGVLGFSAGWGWNGLFNYSVVRSHRQAPARATGVVQTGGRLGSLLGPLMYAAILAHSAYSVGWLVATAEAVVGSTVILVGSRRLRFEATGGASPDAAAL